MSVCSYAPIDPTALLFVESGRRQDLQSLSVYRCYSRIIRFWTVHVSDYHGTVVLQFSSVMRSFGFECSHETHETRKLEEEVKKSENQFAE